MPIRPGVPAPHLAPLLGREPVQRRGPVRYLTLETRSLVNRCQPGGRMPFRFSVNPYRGCAMGCRYCYAAYTHEFLGLTRPESFHEVVYAKQGGEEGTLRALRGLVARGETIALGTATDPYQPGEADFGVTRRFLELVAQFRGARLGLTTKGALVLRDLELLKRIHERSRLSIHVSLISTRADLLRDLEPWAPPPEVRLEVIRRLAGEGLRVYLAVAPVLPALTDSEADLDELLGHAARAGVRAAWGGILFLRSPTKEKYLRWLQGAFPAYATAYERAYAGRVYLGGRYRERVQGLLDRLRRKHGLDGPLPYEGPAGAEPPRQLDLFG